MNLIVSKKGSAEILHVVRDCRRIGDDLVGSNMAMRGLDLSRFDLRWSADDPQETAESQPERKRYAMAAGAVRPGAEPPADLAALVECARTVDDLRAVLRLIVAALPGPGRPGK